MTNIGNILEILLKRNFNNISNEFFNLTQSWKIIVNETFNFKTDDENIATSKIADHSKILDFRHNNILIEVDHSGWIQLLQTKQNIILKIIQRDFKGIQVKNIDFVLAKENTIKSR